MSLALIVLFGFDKTSIRKLMTHVQLFSFRIDSHLLVAYEVSISARLII